MALLLSYELSHKADTLSQQIHGLQLDNSILEKYIEQKTVELGYDEEDKRKGKKKTKKQSIQTLNSDQKYQIAHVIHEDLLAEIETHRKNSEKMIDTLRAILEETDIRIGELKRDAYEFKRDVVVGAENSRTGKIMAERAIRYFEDKIKVVDGVIEKLRLKNATLKSQVNKVELQLSQKQETGDTLHYIDFHQLQIENKQFVAKIEERNEELLSVKSSAGKTIQALNEYKRKLNDKLEESQYLKNEIEEKKLSLKKIVKEISKTAKDTKVEKSTKNRLRQQIEESAEMPHIEDYIIQKKELYELDSKLGNWQKKVELLEMSAKKTRNMAIQSSR